MDRENQIDENKDKWKDILKKSWKILRIGNIIVLTIWIIIVLIKRSGH